MFFEDSDNEYDLEEDYYGHEYFDYILEDMYDSLYDLDFERSDDEYDDDDSLKSVPPEEEINQMKRCLAICAGLNQDRKDGLFCDATILVDDKTFPVHKTVLKASSSYFTAMFTGDFSEKNEQQVEIHGVTPQVFALLLDYIYGSKINLTFENIKEVYMAGDMLCIDALITECKDFIKNNWVLANDVQSVFEMAKEFGLDNVTQEIIHQGRTHLVNFMGGKDYRELSESFLFTILDGRNTLKYLGQELMVASNLLRWILFRPEERLPDAAERLFATIHFEFVSKEDLTEMLTLISSNEDSLSADVLARFRGYIEKMYKRSHQRMIDQQVKLILPDESEHALLTNVQIHTFSFEEWKWDSLPCQVPKKPQSFIVSSNDLYIFTNEGCTKVDLTTKKTQSFPNFPEKRAMSVYSVFNKTLYVTGGCKEGTKKPLGEILYLKPSSNQWSRSITWRKSKCDASSISHGHLIYFVGGRNFHDKYNRRQSECFSYNTLNKYFQKMCNLDIYTSRPKLAVYEDVLYVFSSEQVKGVDLKVNKPIPDSAFKKLECTLPILAVCSVKEGILIAYSHHSKILLALCRPKEEPFIEYLGLVSKPPGALESTLFSYFELIFYTGNQS